MTQSDKKSIYFLIGFLLTVLILVFSLRVRTTVIIKKVEPVLLSQPQIINNYIAQPVEKQEISVSDLIVKLAFEYGVDPKTALRIGNCESGLKPDARNRKSTATGVFQWLEGTWYYIGSPGDRLNAEDNIRAFMVWYPKNPGWWECQ